MALSTTLNTTQTTTQTTGMPRVALILPRLSQYGGAERFAWRLAERLAAEPMAVDFICARQETDAPLGVRPVVLGRKGLFRVLKMLHFCLASSLVTKRGKYDLCIALGKTQGQELVRVGGGPLRNFWKLSARAYAPGLPRAWKMLRRRLSPANRLALRLEKRQLQKASVIAANSHLVRDWLLAAHPWLDPAKLRLIYTLPDFSRFPPRAPEDRAQARSAWGLPEDAVIVGTAGSNFRLKGVEPLIRAMAELPANHHLLVAGDRNPGRFAKLAHKLGVEHRVRFLGRVSDMAGFYAGLDIFCLPTFYDACSNAVLEALARGVATVSSASNGSSRFLPPNRVLDDPGDHSALADCLKRVAREPAPGPFAYDLGQDAKAGLDAFAEMVREMLEKKKG